MSYFDLIKNIGLPDSQAKIIAYLLTVPSAKASTITKKTTLPRGVVYSNLDKLIDQELVTKQDAPNAVSTFSLTHPSKLQNILQTKKKELQHQQQSLQNSLPELISLYNLSNNKPNIQFYEGIEGIKKVINDTLTSKTEIYTYADLEKVNKYTRAINDEYTKKRDKLPITKKVLLVDSPYTKSLLKDYKKTNLSVRFVKNAKQFATVLQIYDGKISYTTLSKDKMIGIIIQDKNIFEMHKTLFENMWENANES